jgi:hypothetical protein
MMTRKAKAGNRALTANQKGTGLTTDILKILAPVLIKGAESLIEAPAKKLGQYITDKFSSGRGVTGSQAINMGMAYAPPGVNKPQQSGNGYRLAGTKPQSGNGIIKKQAGNGIAKKQSGNGIIKKQAGNGIIKKQSGNGIAKPQAGRGKKKKLSDEIMQYYNDSIEKLPKNRALSNFEIEDICHDRYTKFRFLGVFSFDNRVKSLNKNSFYIVNNKPSGDPGEHWLAVIRGSGKYSYFYDSFGRSGKSFGFMPSIKSSDDDVEQKLLEINCGPRSIAFIDCCHKFGVLKTVKVL